MRHRTLEVLFQELLDGRSPVAVVADGLLNLVPLEGLAHDGPEKKSGFRKS